MRATAVFIVVNAEGRVFTASDTRYDIEWYLHAHMPERWDWVVWRVSWNGHISALPADDFMKGAKWPAP